MNKTNKLEYKINIWQSLKDVRHFEVPFYITGIRKNATWIWVQVRMILGLFRLRAEGEIKATSCLKERGWQGQLGPFHLLLNCHSMRKVEACLIWNVGEWLAAFLPTCKLWPWHAATVYVPTSFLSSTRICTSRNLNPSLLFKAFSASLPTCCYMFLWREGERERRGREETGNHFAHKIRWSCLTGKT